MKAHGAPVQNPVIGQFKGRLEIAARLWKTIQIHQHKGPGVVEAGRRLCADSSGKLRKRPFELALPQKRLCSLQGCLCNPCWFRGWLMRITPANDNRDKQSKSYGRESPHGQFEHSISTWV